MKMCHRNEKHARPAETPEILKILSKLYNGGLLSISFEGVDAIKLINSVFVELSVYPIGIKCIADLCSVILAIVGQCFCC